VTAAGNAIVDGGCNMMMPASAFSICVWALVMASVLAPVGFGTVSSPTNRGGRDWLRPIWPANALCLRCTDAQQPHRQRQGPQEGGESCQGGKRRL
jgi:hypothetical protein